MVAVSTRSFQFGLCILLCAIPLPALAHRATPQERKQDWSVCENQNANPAQRDAGCTSLLHSHLKDKSKIEMAYCNRGVARYGEGKYMLALKDINHALRLKPGLYGLYESRANTYYLMGKWQLAIRDYDTALRLNPNDADAYVYRGVCYLYLHAFATAMNDFKAAIRIKPNAILTSIAIANAYDLTQQDQKAIGEYKRIIRLHPRSALAYADRGNFYRRRGKFAAAASDYKTALSFMPHAPAIRYELAICEQHLGETHLSSADMEAAVKVDPKIAAQYAQAEQRFRTMQKLSLKDH